jgi:hypothetical protein
MYYSPYHYENIVSNCDSIKETWIIHVQGEEEHSFPRVERILDTNITSAWFCDSKGAHGFSSALPGSDSMDEYAY